MKYFSILIFMILSYALAEDNILRLELTPEEAQQLLAEQSVTLDYAKKINENSLPVRQNARGNFIYQGKIIDNPSDYVEEQYLAEQSHGQDGLGRYIFGYKTDNLGRIEAKNANGEIRGQYKYIDPAGDDRIVNYWSDSLGFHQEDNRPVVVLEPVTEEPVVRQAREEHLRLWEEAARAAKLNPDPMSDVYNRLANQYDEHQAQLEQANEIVDSEENRNAYKLNRLETKKYWEPKDVEQDIQSQPRGFFYKFQYPVERARNIRDSSEFRKVKRESTTATPTTNPTEKLKILKLDQTNDTFNLKVAAVHDPQVPRIGNLRKSNLKSDRIAANHNVQTPSYRRA